jgi:hypothetical protein
MCVEEPFWTADYMQKFLNLNTLCYNLLAKSEDKVSNHSYVVYSNFLFVCLQDQGEFVTTRGKVSCIPKGGFHIATFNF